MDLLTIFILTFLSAIILIYWYLTLDYNYWSSRGIKGPRPIPFFGNLLDFLIIPQPLQELKWFKTYGKIYGHYMGKIPVINIMDAEIIKTVLVKDFHLFVDRNRFLKPKFPIGSRFLTFLTGDDWKRVRSIVSPTFTSAKMKTMYPKIRECLTDLMTHLDGLATRKQEMNVKDVYGNYAMDVIATCALATKTHVYKSLDNPFVLYAQKHFDVNPIRRVANLLLPLFVQKLLGINGTTSEQFFLKSVQHILHNRRQTESQKPNDLLQLLIDAKSDDNITEDDLDVNEAHHVNEGEEELLTKKKTMNINIVNKQLTENEIIAQAIQFLLVGYRTTGTTLSFCTYDLALNPQTQQQLYEEVIEAMDANGDITYEELAKLAYLDSVLSETLRLNSTVPRITRIASVEYKLGHTGITLQPGQQIDFPIHAIHNSEENYPNPFQYDPDRFMPQNRHKIKPYTYLPFGAGPRNCVAMRFALLEAKLALANIIRNYRFYPTANTSVPLRYQRSINLISPQRLIVGIEKRV